MKLFLIAAVVVLLLVVVLTACARQSAAPQAEDVTFDAAVQRQIADDSLAFLRARIDDSASLGQITDVFAELCAEPTANEEILFESGVYAFTGEPSFTISLARQIPDGRDEFYQIRVELSFLPDAENESLFDEIWIDPANEDAFSAVLRSAAFTYAETHTAYSVDIRIDETL